MTEGGSSFWSALSIWDWWNLAGIGLVFVGVVGELIVGLWKPPPNPYNEYFSNDPSSGMPNELFFGKRQWELKEAKRVRKMHRLEVLSCAVLVLGLLVEVVVFVPGLTHEWREKEVLRTANLQLAKHVEELRKENNDFAIAQDPRKIDSLALIEELRKVHGVHFLLINTPDWEAARLAGLLEWCLQNEYRMHGEYRQWTFSRIVTVLDIPDGVLIGFPRPPNPFEKLPAAGFTREERMQLNEDEVKAYTDFKPSKASVEAAEILAKSLGSTGIAVENRGEWLNERFGVLSRLRISTQTVPTNTVVILIGHKPDPNMILLKSLRQKAWDIKRDRRSSAGNISNAWHAVYVAEENYRSRQIRLGLWPTNAPHTKFAPGGFAGDGTPLDMNGKPIVP